MYAIVDAGGKQYKVSPGDTVEVDKLTSEPGAVIALERVLMVVDGSKAIAGTPYVKGAEVKAEVLGSGKGKKVLVYKKRPRRVYEKLRGHRQQYTTLKIKEVVFGG